MLLGALLFFIACEGERSSGIIKASPFITVTAP